MPQAPCSLLHAHYGYGLFAEPIRATGPLAAANPFRFSTKYQDAETDLLYYGYRYYSPSLGRWLSRDPIDEGGGANLHAFAGNDAQSRVDLLGFNFDSADNALLPVSPLAPSLPEPIRGWVQAVMHTIEWVMGAPGQTDYPPDSLESRQMSRSPVAADLRHYFLSKNQGKLCKHWEPVSNFRGTFGLRHYLMSVPNGTAEFVGSARGDVSILDVECTPGCPLGRVRAAFRLTNTTSLTSLFYGIWPNAWNVLTPGRPFANWIQTYTWHESFNCVCFEEGVEG